MSMSVILTVSDRDMTGERRPRMNRELAPLPQAVKVSAAGIQLQGLGRAYKKT